MSSLVVHFDSRTWARESTPNPANRNTLNDVVALGNGDMVAVGVAQDTSGGGIVPRSLLLRRTGTSWSSPAVPPGETELQDQLLSVAAVSAASVWAVGYYSSPSSGLYEPLLVHWTADGGAGTLATAQPGPHRVRPGRGPDRQLGRQPVGGRLHLPARCRERHPHPEGHRRLGLRHDPREQAGLGEDEEADQAGQGDGAEEHLAQDVALLAGGDAADDEKKANSWAKLAASACMTGTFPGSRVPTP